MNPGLGPVIRIEIDGIRERVQNAMMTMAHEWDDMIRAELDSTLSGDRVEAMVKDAVRRQVDESLREAIVHYFKYGEGGRAIKDMTGKMLNNNLNGDKNEPSENF